MLVCKESLELSRRLISSDQVPYQEDLEAKFMDMQASLGTLMDEEDVDSASATVRNLACTLLNATTSYHRVNYICVTI